MGLQSRVTDCIEEATGIDVWFEENNTLCVYKGDWDQDSFKVNYFYEAANECLADDIHWVHDMVASETNVLKFKLVAYDDKDSYYI